jgi:hypothetical protein
MAAPDGISGRYRALVADEPALGSEADRRLPSARFRSYETWPGVPVNRMWMMAGI